MANWKWSKFQRFWFPVILYSGIIFYVSSVPNVKTPLQEIQFDKVLHILAYVPFGLFVARGIINTWGSPSYRMLLGAVLLASFFYGLSDEFHQSFVSGRESSMGDVIVDTIGGVTGGAVYLLFLRYISRKRFRNV